MGLTITITGAGGFIGRACVDAAIARGHQVRALIRSAATFPEGVEQITCDLSSDADYLIKSITGSDVVIHTASSMSGDPALAQRDTLAATRNLVAAMAETKPRLVLLSSIAVYDADARAISEDTTLDPHPETRDAYAQSKIAQEALLNDAEIETWIARPGAVFGPNRLWNAHLGQQLGPIFLRMGDATQIPVIDIESCARALIHAAETPAPEGKRAINLVSDNLPNARAFLTALGPGAPGTQLPFPRQIPAFIGRLFRPLPIRLPGLLQPRTLTARFGPKTYSNTRAKADLNWSPAPWSDALQTAQEASP
ncbi:NAD(P)-dependent oxidoreductase [Alisedimentitalea sp. MJ-SS2]|uniref:NAD-dependent epimerase/dehydratase family protein n=1 Tax=Aliisedimentitalea sp. MJ-SS2 TaxID=3049795 RepID=UPI002911B5B9|nr:NAD(P)-dependent oxidoreductase [Alisedimentitalea sp. MJ-SS2]MDU8926232.1 NAD(P)-dependent oxidoreductase [Alisedimentitalea sp. MJ-SS2]